MAHYWLFNRLVQFNRVHPEIMVHIHASNAIDEYSVIEHDFGILYGAGNWGGLEAAPLFAERIRPSRPAILTCRRSTRSKT